MFLFLICQVLRATAKLSTTILYIPLVSTVVQLFNCHSTWAATGWTCYSGPHLVLAAIASVVIFCFSVFAFVGTSASPPPPLQWSTALSAHPPVCVAESFAF